MDSQTPNVLPPPPDFPYILDGVHDGIYQQAKYFWNELHSSPYLSLDFFWWCAKNWVHLRLLYFHASESNFGHLFEQPYRYFQAMVIVGALTELDLYEHRFSMHDHFGRAIIGFLFQIRNFAADEWHESLTFNDSESDYYAEAVIYA